MRISLVLRASVLALALVGFAAAPAFAAPQMISSDPEGGATLHQPPARVTVTLSEPVTGASEIEVIDDCGEEVSAGETQVGGTANNELSVAVGDAPHHGTYLVKWIGTGVTGTGSGQFTFTVHGGTGCDGRDGGGHGNHGGENGSGDNGNGSGHGGGHSGSGDAGHSGHSSGSGAGDHSGMNNHSGTGHMGSGDHKMGGKHDDRRKHGGKHGRKHGKHGGRHGQHEGGRHGGDGDPDVVASGPFGPASDIPTGTTVVIALGLAVLMGAAGGWVLRVSSPR